MLKAGRYEGNLSDGTVMRLRWEGVGRNIQRLSGDIWEADGTIQSFVVPGSDSTAKIRISSNGTVREIVDTAGSRARTVELTISAVPPDGAEVHIAMDDGRTLTGQLVWVSSFFRKLVIGIGIWPGVRPREAVDGDSAVGKALVQALASAGIDARLESRQDDMQGMVPLDAVGLAHLHNWLAGHVQPADLSSTAHSVSLLLCNKYAEGGHAETKGIMYEIGPDRPREGAAVFLGTSSFDNLSLDAWRNELVFAILHEVGHALNLPHAFLRQPPGNAALSWMAYPQDYTIGTEKKGAASFWDAFGQGCFDEAEVPYLRHAYHCDIAPGASPFDKRVWQGFTYDGNAKAALVAAAPVVSLRIEPLKSLYVLGEPVFARLIVQNTGDRRITLPGALDPTEGLISISIIHPSGRQQDFRPPAHLCQTPRLRRLSPGARLIFDGVNLSFSREGPVFEEPGVYRIEARFIEASAGSPKAASSELRLLYPTRHEELFARTLYADEKLCRAIWLRHPFVALERWKRLVDDDRNIPTDRANTTFSYLHFIAALGWLTPITAADRRNDDMTKLRKIKAHLGLVDPTDLPSGVAGRMRKHRIQRPRTPGSL